MKVLILTYSFPEEISAGALRPHSWYKNFSEFNIEPIVITKNWANEITSNLIEQVDEKGTIVKLKIKPNRRDKLLLKYGVNRYSFLRRLLTLYYAVFSYLFFKNDALSPIYFEASNYLKKNKVDIIIATGEPFILFKYASKLSQQFQIPWIADYRDGWSTNYAIHSTSFIEKFLMKNYYKPLEKKYIKTASAITTVSQPIAEELKKLHHKNTQLILNGFDEDNYQFLSHQQSESVFTIAYAGSILSYQRLDVFMKGFESFIKASNANSKVIFYGLNDLLCQLPKPHTFVDKSLHERIEYTDSMIHSEILKKLSNAHILLVLSNEAIDGSCSKIFEYLALQRKIIVSVNDSGTLEKIINETNSGILCDNANDVKSTLIEAYNEWLMNKEVKSSTCNFEKYSRKEQTKLLAKLVNELVN